jgi:putative membrane protein
MMAWIRTSTSLITFGFGVYKFFQFELRKTEPIDAIIGPREFAMIMIITGLLASCWLRFSTGVTGTS